MPEQKIRSFDLLGNIAVINFPDKFSQKEKINFAKNLIKENKNIKTVVEKIGKIKGRLRKFEFKHLAGEKTTEILYKENNCVFRFDLGTTYFSPRLSNERKEIALNIKKNDDVLVMFAGVAPFPIVIAKNSNAKKIISNEINKEANKYASLNIELNKVKNKVELISGDIKKSLSKLKELNPKGFDVIVMPRPQLKDSFLEQAFELSKKGTRIFYYDFCKIEEIGFILDKVNLEAKKFDKKIKITGWKKAGEIAPYKIRIRIDFKILT